MESRLTEEDRKRISEFAAAATYERHPDMLAADEESEDEEDAATSDD